MTYTSHFDSAWDKFLSENPQMSILPQEILDEYKFNFMMEFQRMMSIYVWYGFDCGCGSEQAVLLDRYPMSEKIRLSECPKCKKCCNAILKKPIQFYFPYLNQTYEYKNILDLGSTSAVNSASHSIFIRYQMQLLDEQEEI